MLNIGILELEESGKLEKLRQKWWSNGGFSCQVTYCIALSRIGKLMVTSRMRLMPIS